MAEINAELIKKVREETGAGVMDVRAALIEADGDENKAKEILRQRGIENASKRSERATAQGLIETYVHMHKIGVVVEVNCETDFVAKTDEFKNLAHEVALHVASMNPETVEELLDQEYVKDPSKKISELVKEVIAKTGENVQVRRFVRYELGN